MEEYNLKKKLVYLDVGTHFGQEFTALVGDALPILWFKFLKIRIASFILRRKEIHFIKFNEAVEISRALKVIRLNKGDLYSILVEPNYRVFGSKAYRIANKVLCIALGDEGRPIGFDKLYFPDSFKMSQGASLYKSKNNIDFSDADTVIVVSSSEFAHQLKMDLDLRFGHDQYELMVRINCEGAEDSVIYALKAEFKDKFNYVFGRCRRVKRAI